MTPGEQLTDEQRYRNAHTAYWAMMAMDIRAFNSLSDEQKAKHQAESARLLSVMNDLGPRLRR